MISIVIPTMQRADETKALLSLYDAHPLVGEIIIVNNSDREMEFELPSKCREVYRGPNLFVNPAWNLGVQEASCDVVAISNDDILIDPRLLDHAHEIVSAGGVGLLGPATEAVYGHGSVGDGFKTRRAHEAGAGFGVLFFFRRTKWVPIPAEMKIYAGEAWEFWSQDAPSLEFSGTRIEIEMHASSGDPKFLAMKKGDNAYFEKDMARVWGTKHWHKESLRYLRARGWRRRLRQVARRLRRWVLSR